MTKLSKSQILDVLRCLSPQERHEIFEEFFPASWEGASRQTRDEKRLPKVVSARTATAGTSSGMAKPSRGHNGIAAKTAARRLPPRREHSSVTPDALPCCDSTWNA